MIDRRPTRPPRTPRRLVAALGLVVAGVVALAVAVALALWIGDQVASTRLWRVESVVAPLVVAAGVLAAGWVGASSLLAGACATVRAAGGAWRAGEDAVQRWAPGAVRRALALAVAAGIGLGGAAGAHATTEAPPAPAVSAEAVDLGWTPTADRAPVPTDGATEVASGIASSTAGAPSAAEPAALPAAPAAAAGAGAPHRVTAPPTADAAPAPGPEGTTTGSTDLGAAAAGVPASPTAAERATAPSAPPPAAAGATAASAPSGSDTPSGPAAGTVVVQAGDTLWGLAARSLGPDATDAAIAAEWPRWYAANAPAIGPDPDVLLPGQVLTVPTTDAGSSR